MTLYAVWQAEMQLDWGSQIIYNANGGTGAPANQTIYGSSLPVALSSQTPTRTGYTFLGWATSATATTPKYQPGGQYGTTADERGGTLYAVWKQDSPTATAPEISGNTKPSFTPETAPEISGNTKPSVSHNPPATGSTPGDSVLTQIIQEIRDGVRQVIAGIIRRYIIACPVDVALYDAGGNLLARTQQGKATNEGSHPGLITIEGDIKIVIDTDGHVNEIRFRAYGSGTMTYTVQDIDKNTGTVKSEKVFRDVALILGKEMRSAVSSAVPGTSLMVTVNGTDTAEVKVNGSETKLSATGESDNTHPFFNRGAGSGQQSPPKTGVGIDGKMVALMAVIFLDIAFMGWLAWNGKRKRWPKRMKPTLALQLPALE